MKRKLYIALFAILYAIVAFVSFYHGIFYMSLANETWMAIILSIAFEIGQAAVLFALLTDRKDRKKIMPWCLMAMFTLVQILGNVYSSYKYIILNSLEDLKYFKEPIFIWTDLPDDQATVIVTFILGAILPIAALMLTGMVTNYLEDDNSDEKTKSQAEEPKPLIDEENLKKLEDVTQDAPVAPQIVKEEPKEQPQVKADETPAEQMIVDSTAEPVKKANEDRNGKQTHLVSL